MNSFTAGPGEMPYDADYGSDRRMVQRKCSQCHRIFSVSTDGEYVMHIVCDQCLAVEASIRRAQRIARVTFTTR